ncbi:MAG: cysteine desulfurase [Myxococcales bacterium]|nr:cysteine desulfurase [Myxococcales bacterium]MCB9642952.1 cysteine desulfurase [Myxococcales bacterium]
MIYMDYNATTPMDRRVADAMVPFLYEHFGNPSSSHVYGQKTRQAIDEARAEVAALIHAQPSEIIFTSGGTESNNMVIKGVAESKATQGRHIIISAFEHPAITEPCAYLAKQGYEITQIPVDAMGILDVQALEAAIRPDTILVSVMLANNEVGTLQPLQAISALTRPRGILFHSDASQAVGKTEVDVEALGVDMLTIAGHKFYGPKGIGALYLRQGLRLPSFLHGAGHERGQRAGTENVIEIVGLGVAAKLAREELPEEIERLSQWRDHLWRTISAALPDKVRLHGHPEQRLCNTLNIGFCGLKGSDIAQALEGKLAFSLGSACHSSVTQLSGVLQAMGVEPDSGMGAVRLSLGRMTTLKEVEEASRLLIQTAQGLYDNAH